MPFSKPDPADENIASESPESVLSDKDTATIASFVLRVESGSGVFEKDLFLQAIEIEDAAALEIFLDRECGEDRELRIRLDNLLDIQARTGFLEPSKLIENVKAEAFGRRSGEVTEELPDDNYAVGDEISRGGMGSIRIAEDQKLERSVAIKVMHRNMAHTPAANARFLLEAKVLAQLAHPNIVPIYDIVWENGNPLFYSMKLVKGRTLQAIIDELRNESPKTPREYNVDRLLQVFRKVCDAMAFSHSRGIIHRDLKPENIMVGEFGEVLVMDWGLAKRLGDEPIREIDDSIDPVIDSFAGTMHGDVMGTPRYMSPEQARGEITELDRRSDIYSLGGILYSILTLRPPVEGETLQELLDKVSSGKIIAPTDLRKSTGSGGESETGEVSDARTSRPLPHSRGGKVPLSLSSVAMKMLKLDKAERYQSVDEVISEIAAYQEGFATNAERAGAWVQIKLLILRHRLFSAMLLTIMILSIGFLMKVMSSERRANTNAEKAVESQELAEKRSDEARRSLARAQIALADAAWRAFDVPGLESALAGCPEELRDDSWNYMNQKLQSSRITLDLPDIKGSGTVTSVPNRSGEFLFAGLGKDILVIDAETNQTAAKISTDFNDAKQMSVSGDGNVLAITKQGQHEIHFYDLNTRKPAGRMSLKEVLFGIVLNDDGSLLFAETGDGKGGFRENRSIHLVDMRDHEILWSKKKSFGRAEFHPTDDRLFLFGEAERDVRTMNLDGETLSITTLDSLVTSLSINSDGSTVAAATISGTLHLLDSKDGQIQQSKKLHPATIGGVSWLGGDYLLTIGDQGLTTEGKWVFRIWKLPYLDPVCTFLGLKKKKIDPPSWDVDYQSGHLIASQENSIKRWSLPIGRERDVVSFISEQGWSGAFLDDFTLLARDGYGLNPYDLRVAGNPVKLPSSLPKQRFNRCAIHRETQTVAIATRNAAQGSTASTLQLYRMSDGELKKTTTRAIPSYAGRMEFDGSGKNLAFSRAIWGTMCFVVDTTSGEVLHSFSGEAKFLIFAGGSGNLVLSKNGRGLDESTNSVLSSVDFETGDVLETLRVPYLVRALTSSPDFSRIGVGGSDGRLYLYDADTLRESGSFRVHDGEVTAVSFHPSLPVVATGSIDRSVKIWSLSPEPRLLKEFLGLGGTPVNLAFNPSGTLLAVEGQEKAFRVYETGLSEK